MQSEPPKADPPKRKRRWFQYSLWTLLLFVTGMAVFFGWCGAKLRRAADQNALIEVAERNEGRVEVYYSGPDWIPRRLRRHVIGLSFDLSNDDPRREDVLLCLAGFRELQWLDLGIQPIDEEGLRYVGQMDQLSRLTSTNSSITDAGAAQLARLPNLQELNLSECRIESAAVRKLTDCPHLRKLMLRRAVFADELVDLGHVRDLSLLDLADCDFPSRLNGAPKLAKWLAGLDALEELYLRHWPIEPGDIEAISGLKNLRILDLTACTIGAGGLRSLVNLRKLKHLALAPNSIDDEAIQVLHKFGQLETLSLNPGDDILPDDAWNISAHEALRSAAGKFTGPDGRIPDRSHAFEVFSYTQLPVLERALPSIQIDTMMPDYPEIRCIIGTRACDAPPLIKDQEEETSAGGGVF